MSLIRGFLTLIFAPVLTVFFGCIAMIDLLWIRRSERKGQLFPRWWGRSICRLAGVQVVVEGMENINAAQTYIFAGNHCSQFDIFSFQGYCPHDFRWIAKKELFRIPVVGRVMHLAGYIPIDRSRGREAVRSLDRAAKRIAAGSSVLIFPEGTRSADGTLQEFKAGAVMLAIKSGVPIVPVGFNGSFEVLPKGSFFAKPGKIVIRIGSPVQTSHYRATDKQQLVEELQQAVAGQLEGKYLEV